MKYYSKLTKSETLTSWRIFPTYLSQRGSRREEAEAKKQGLDQCSELLPKTFFKCIFTHCGINQP